MSKALIRITYDVLVPISPQDINDEGDLYDDAEEVYVADALDMIEDGLEETRDDQVIGVMDE